MIRRQRTLATVYRGTPATAVDGNRYMSAFAAIASQVAVNIQEPTADRLLAVFGADFPGTAVAYALPDAITEEDRLKITSGPFLGSQYLVTKRVRHRQGSRNDHDELGLVTTAETLP